MYEERNESPLKMDDSPQPKTRYPSQLENIKEVSISKNNALSPQGNSSNPFTPPSMSNNAPGSDPKRSVSEGIRKIVKPPQVKKETSPTI